jgi:ABC-type nitrate/sulfonate/bicarbonate transport system substrate-binding protein
LTKATREGEAFAVDHPRAALGELLDSTSGLDREEQRAQLHALLSADAFDTGEGFDSATLHAWARWDLAHGIVDQPVDVSAAFPG